jgi:hypothetical protein
MLKTPLNFNAVKNSEDHRRQRGAPFRLVWKKIGGVSTHEISTI